MRPPVAALLLLSLALAACGGGGGSSDEEGVRETVNGVYDALADKDAGRVCDALSKEGRRHVAKTGGGKPDSCEQVFEFGLELAGNRLDGVEQAEVTDVELDGDKATATVEYEDESGEVALVKEGGEWKLSDIGAPASASGRN